ncbi:MAG: outer membrane protein assembly factor BamD [Prevotella sp.]|jgi:outer membrane protein assembly factor BamD|nr:outer membrane protein assembly factor BamD [Prevotella sp.]MCR5068444.1 outer membrane protein assembly factor BamD [Prevotella sp.]
MKKYIVLTLMVSVTLLSSCVSEFNVVYRTDDYSYRYEYAKEMYAQGKYSRANLLFGEMVTLMKGTENGEECLFMYAMSAYMTKEYDAAAEIFKKYFSSYPKGLYAEDACFYIGECLYKTVPEPRLDQTPTLQAIKAYQDFMDIYPYSDRKKIADSRMYELQDKLVEKEYLNAKLYYNLGTYFGNCIGSGGNNYEACIVTAQNALKEYPYTSLREDFASLIMKSKYELAVHSVKEKQVDRFQDAEDECYGFINEYPDSKERALAEKYIDKCKKFSEGKLQFD